MKNVIGIDPGFAALGLTRVFILPESESVDMLSVVRTEKSAKKLGILATEDNVARAMTLAYEVGRWITADTIAICCESQSWPRNSSTAAKLGMCWGVISAIAAAHMLPVLQASPQRIKKVLTGKKTSSKDEVISALECRYDELPDWPSQRSLIEHAADALAAVVACLDSSTIKMVRAFIASEG